MRKLQILLVLSLLPSLIPRVVHPIPTMHFIDFEVYYTASTLAREHQGAAIYAGADTGVDPQLRPAGQGTAFAERAHRLGIDDVMLYVYPPVLADALIPISLIPLRLAEKVWVALCLVAVLPIAWLIARLIPVALASLGGLTLLVAMVISQPVFTAISWGQITVMMLLLWVLGIWLYRKGSLGASAAILALATTIKLTPLIVVVPFLVWREWKWLRWYAVALAAIVVAMLLVNSPAALADYVSHVIPSMSRGITFLGNESVPVFVQLVYGAAMGRSISPELVEPVPALVLTAGKALSLLAIGVAAIQVVRAGTAITRFQAMLTLALFAMLSAAVAPVSWRHAYTVALPALALLWGKALRGGKLNARVWLLAFCTLAMTSFLNQWAILFLCQRNWQLAGALVAVLMPASAVLLVWVELGEMIPRQGNSWVEAAA